MPRLAVVVPAYNEAAVLETFHARLARVLDELPLEASVLYVDDGSSDDTWRLIEGLMARDARTGAIKLSRNFGKEAALSAGLARAAGDVVALMDADLQHPPALLRKMLKAPRLSLNVDVTDLSSNKYLHMDWLSHVGGLQQFPMQIHPDSLFQPTHSSISNCFTA